jgi:hypothetical protein
MQFVFRLHYRFLRIRMLLGLPFMPASGSMAVI